MFALAFTSDLNHQTVPVGIANFTGRIGARLRTPYYCWPNGRSGKGVKIADWAAPVHRLACPQEQSFAI
jgi:hypothetical protein